MACPWPSWHAPPCGISTGSDVHTELSIDVSATPRRVYELAADIARGRMSVLAPIGIHLIFSKLLRVPLPAGLLPMPW